MDRNLLRASMPRATDFTDCSERTAKHLAEAYIAQILEAMHTDKREPDYWEGEHLSLAIKAIIKSPQAAVSWAFSALDEPRERPEPGDHIPIDTDTHSVYSLWNDLYNVVIRHPSTLGVKETTFSRRIV